MTTSVNKLQGTSQKASETVIKIGGILYAQAYNYDNA